MNKKDRDFINKKREDSEYFSQITTKNIIRPWTVLLGPNGTGKSMSMKLLSDSLKHNKDIEVLFYGTHKDAPSNKVQGIYGDLDHDYLTAIFSSEGEGMTISFWKWLSTKLPYNELCSNTKPLWLLLDEIDSGLSSDRILYQVHQFIRVINEARHNRDIHIIISCNSYELLEVLHHFLDDTLDILWVPSKKHIKFQSYKEFKKMYFDYAMEVHYHEDLQSN